MTHKISVLGEIYLVELVSGPRNPEKFERFFEKSYPQVKRLVIDLHELCFNVDGIELIFPNVEDLTIDDSGNCCRIIYQWRGIIPLAPRLKTLDMRLSFQTMFEGEDGLRPISKLVNLEHFYVHRLRDAQPSDMLNLTALTHLKDLYYWGCSTNECGDDVDVVDLSNCTELVKATFQESRLISPTEPESDERRYGCPIKFPPSLRELTYISCYGSGLTPHLAEELRRAGVQLTAQQSEMFASGTLNMTTASSGPRAGRPGPGDFAGARPVLPEEASERMPRRGRKAAKHESGGDDDDEGFESEDDDDEGSDFEEGEGSGEESAGEEKKTKKHPRK
ncbi:hypothetical protein PAPYR_3386 [Paratrimastix pyriformis]|uniref:Uncharacterized protein n=1 Tax=Paratrimastix pyriformis TaxID=342808 RepID=A0ABQ8UPI9_9EUKA|nr:hypothetical protein PAPYR_3386 [Paratrimastix pyriformis]